MTPDRLEASHQTARQIVSDALRDTEFSARMSQRAHVWEIEFEFLKAQVRDVLFIALYATGGDTTDLRSRHNRQAAIDLLRLNQPETMFSTLPADLPENLAISVKRLWLMSVNLTDRSAQRWLRLVETAKEFLAEPMDGAA
ncbi:hypothetical protein ACFZAV_40570 [Streptomyces sp. NPDC008343]|uniref:hypothetical protein n=1 Tax=Streptomyces sp. NPDC008343 TaxID=3364828 RepID=UPI0036EAAEFF